MTTEDPVDFISGEEFQIANATPAVYDGDFAITVPVIVSITGTDTNIFTYTLPSTPSANASGTGMTATHGTLYTGPITISTTTDVRAVSAIRRPVGRGVDRIVHFPRLGDQPTGGPDRLSHRVGRERQRHPQAANYAMNPQITQNPLYSAGLEQDLLSLPTVSITTDIPNMWSAVQSQSTNPGIYTNDDNLDQSNGVSMVVPASFEYFNSNGTISLQQNMGLQMEGGYGRNPPFQMHNFRMEFSSDYGPSSLNYPLYSRRPRHLVPECRPEGRLQRCLSWAGSGSPGATGGTPRKYMRDVFASNSMLAMGQPSFASTYVLLYIDGLFWGMYYMLERPDADFAASPLGRDRGGLGGQQRRPRSRRQRHESALLERLSGPAHVEPLCHDLAGLLRAGPGQQCLVPPERLWDTTNYVDLLDPTNYIDYMLMNFYIGNADWPIHNFYAAINTADPTGFKFFSWDAEISLGLINGSYNSNLNVNVLARRAHATWPSMYNVA